MSKLFLLRHLKSQWNEENRFAGWTDGPLEKGYEEKAKLNNEITNVKANYEIKERVMNKDEYTISDALIGTE